MPYVAPAMPGRQEDYNYPSRINRSPPPAIDEATRVRIQELHKEAAALNSLSDPDLARARIGTLVKGLQEIDTLYRGITGVKSYVLRTVTDSAALEIEEAAPGQKPNVFLNEKDGRVFIAEDVQEQIDAQISDKQSKKSEPEEKLDASLEASNDAGIEVFTKEDEEKLDASNDAGIEVFTKEDEEKLDASNDAGIEVFTKEEEEIQLADKQEEEPPERSALAEQEPLEERLHPEEEGRPAVPQPRLLGAPLQFRIIDSQGGPPREVTINQAQVIDNEHIEIFVQLAAIKFIHDSIFQKVPQKEKPGKEETQHGVRDSGRLLKQPAAQQGQAKTSSKKETVFSQATLRQEKAEVRREEERAIEEGRRKEHELAEENLELADDSYKLEKQRQRQERINPPS